jgi:hypothetical protein
MLERSVDRLLAGVLLSFLAAPFGPLTTAQEAKLTERVYSRSQIEVEKALDAMQAYETARLPVLAGFVNAKADTLKNYGNPHYQFEIEVMAQGSSHTLVQVRAKITAWYLGGDSTRTQYALIPSNGRLEEELLDRLSVFLEKENNQRSSATVETPAPPPAIASSSFRASSGSPRLVAPPPASVPAPEPEEAAAPSPVLNSSDPSKLAGEIAAAQSQLDAVEQKAKRSQQQIAELEAVASSRQRITDLAIPKRAQTPVYEQPNALSKVAFEADAGDEFEVVEAREGRWIRVRLENAGQGWLQISEVEQPGESFIFDDSGANKFSAANEVIQTFTGEWTVLKGKSALFVLAQPRAAISVDMLGRSQLAFAKHAFLEGYGAATHSQQVIDGVVVVFMGEKPGVAAATLPQIQRWQEGRISDKLFFERCSLDPPDSFRDLPKN